jgi:hypothetical protein
MHHLMQAQGSQNVNLCQRLSFENKSLEHTTSQCLLENGFPQIIVPSQHQPWKHSCSDNCSCGWPSPGPAHHMADTGAIHWIQALKVCRMLELWGHKGLD